MTTAQTQAFEHLIQAWNRHQDLRVGGAELSSIIAARQELDVARLEMFRVQTA